MVDTYFNFIFVRHPLERLLSAYRDKVQYQFLKESFEWLLELKWTLSHENFQKNLPFPGKTHKVEEHHAEHLTDLDKEGFHAFIKYLVRRADIDEGYLRDINFKLVPT